MPDGMRRGQDESEGAAEMDGVRVMRVMSVVRVMRVMRVMRVVRVVRGMRVMRVMRVVGWDKNGAIRVAGRAIWGCRWGRHVWDRVRVLCVRGVRGQGLYRSLL